VGEGAPRSIKDVIDGQDKDVKYRAAEEVSHSHIGSPDHESRNGKHKFRKGGRQGHEGTPQTSTTKMKLLITIHPMDGRPIPSTMLRLTRRIDREPAVRICP
jgi:hypothetical protein